MLELIFVRHGETDGNKSGTYLGWTDVELNQEGIKQAYNAMQKLSGIKADAIYSSPLKRTRKTAEIINERHGLKIIDAEPLKERNFGIFDNLTYTEICNRFPYEQELWKKDWIHYCIPNGESARQSFDRVNAFINELINKNNHGVYIIVTHMGCVKSLVASLLGMRIDGIWRFKVANGSITKFEIKENHPALTLLNG